MQINFDKGEGLRDLVMDSLVPMVFPEGISRHDVSEKTIPAGEWFLYFQTYERWMSFQDANDSHESKRLGALEHFLKAYSLGQMVSDDVIIPVKTCVGKWNLYARFSVGKLHFYLNQYKDFAPGTKFLLIGARA